MFLCLALGGFGGGSVPGRAEPSRRNIDFNRQVLPILSDNCFACHGPDEKQRKAKLRLDVEEEATRANASGDRAVVPGRPAESTLIARLRTTDEDDLMPPPKTGKKLTGAQVAVLEQWIQEGAKYDRHWAFVPLERPAVPEVKRRKGVRNEIDRFVVARLEQEKIEPSPEASRETLIRRVSLDLNGLPPTPQEVDAFLADKSPQAYEQLVDRLLASPRYGEQMARAWLDAARYADSHGYHIDSERAIWKWRDWVIDAFNANMPFDRFSTEQLAGDLLPEPTVSQKVATGYVRSNMSTGEGGAIEEEYLAKYTFDRTETTGTIWLGLTLSCARCHSHKYDPISHKEYFGLYSFFHNLDEPVMDGNRPNPDPFLKLPTAAQEERQAWLKRHIEEGQRRLDAPLPEVDAAEEVWAKAWRGRLTQGVAPLRPASAESKHGATLRIGDDGSVMAGGTNPETDIFEVRLPLPAGRWGGLRLEALADPSLPQQGAGRADDGSFRLSGLEVEVQPTSSDTQPAEPQRWAFGRAVASVWEGDQSADKAIDDGVESAWSPGKTPAGSVAQALFVLKEPAQVGEGATLRVRLRFEASKHRQSLGRFRLAVVGGEPALAALFPPKPPSWRAVGPFPSSDPLTGLKAIYPPDQKVDLDGKYRGVREEIRWQERGDLVDGRRHELVNELHGVHGAYFLHRALTLPEPRRVEFAVRADDVFRFWVDGELAAERLAREQPGEGPRRVVRDLAAGEHQLLLKVVNLQGTARFRFDMDQEGPDRLSPEVAAVLLLGNRPEGANGKTVRQYYRHVASAAWKEQAQQVALWREEEEEIDRSIATTLIAKERRDRRETRLLVRGEYDKPGEVVAPGVPSILSPWPQGAPTNRLGLARWLMGPNHPLTARVTVNRFWQHYFGVGLVKTTEDFGVQGERPSHPELLDWLATEFMRTGWDVRGLQRLIVTSGTYRQVSAWRPGLASRDPENRLLWRGPRFRSDAEVVRDLALAASGLLVEQVGGRSARPYEPPGLWEAVSYNNAQKYVQDRGEGNYRRSLYTHWKRQSPPPYLLLFDAPTRETCVVRRPRTNTPLQALALLNDPQFVEASRALARRMLVEGGSKVEDRLAYGFRLLTARRPSREEIRLLRRLLDEQLEEYRRDPRAAAELLAVGATPPQANLNPSEWAAWTTIASLLLNLDETLTKS